VSQKWMVKWRTVLIQEDLSKGTVIKKELFLSRRTRLKHCGMQLSTYSMPSYHVKTSDWNVCWIYLWSSWNSKAPTNGTKRMQKRVKRNKRPTLNKPSPKKKRKEENKGVRKTNKLGNSGNLFKSTLMTSQCSLGWTNELCSG